MGGQCNGRDSNDDGGEEGESEEMEKDNRGFTVDDDDRKMYRKENREREGKCQPGKRIRLWNSWLYGWMSVRLLNVVAFVFQASDYCHCLEE